MSGTHSIDPESMSDQLFEWRAAANTDLRRLLDKLAEQGLAGQELAELFLRTVARDHWELDAMGVQGSLKQARAEEVLSLIATALAVIAKCSSYGQWLDAQLAHMRHTRDLFRDFDRHAAAEDDKAFQAQLSKILDLDDGWAK